MKNINLKTLLNEKIIFVIITIVITSIIYLIIKKFISSRIESINKKTKDNYKKQTTYLKLSASTIKYIILVIDVVIILQIFGINVTSIIAGVGIVSVITGLALQDAFKDIISGFNIIVDNYFAIGDVIEIEGVTGKVISVELKVTKIKDINNQNILVISNRNISKALNISNQYDIDIPLPYEEKIEKIEKILDEIVIDIKKDKNVTDIKYIGINDYLDSAIIYKLRLWSKPENQPQSKRNALRTIKLKLDKENISIPYMQVDIRKK